MKNVVKLNHYLCPSGPEKAIDGWVKYYNEKRFHESFDNPTPRDVYLGNGEKIHNILTRKGILAETSSICANSPVLIRWRC